MILVHGRGATAPSILEAEKVIIGTFSQGACLASEFVARHARRYGGLPVFSSGLIGPPGTPRDYPVSLDETPVFLGCSTTDFHVATERVDGTAAISEQMDAVVTKRLYPDMGHTIIQDEIDQAQKIVQAVGDEP